MEITGSHMQGKFGPQESITVQKAVGDFMQVMKTASASTKHYALMFRFAWNDRLSDRKFEQIAKFAVAFETGKNNLTRHCTTNEKETLLRKFNHEVRSAIVKWVDQRLWAQYAAMVPGPDTDSVRSDEELDARKQKALKFFDDALFKFEHKTQENATATLAKKLVGNLKQPQDVATIAHGVLITGMPKTNKENLLNAKFDHSRKKLNETFEASGGDPFYGAILREMGDQIANVNDPHFQNACKKIFACGSSNDVKLTMLAGLGLLYREEDTAPESDSLSEVPSAPPIQEKPLDVVQIHPNIMEQIQPPVGDSPQVNIEIASPPGALANPAVVEKTRGTKEPPIKTEKTLEQAPSPAVSLSTKLDEEVEAKVKSLMAKLKDEECVPALGNMWNLYSLAKTVGKYKVIRFVDRHHPFMDGYGKDKNTLRKAYGEGGPPRLAMAIQKALADRIPNALKPDYDKILQMPIEEHEQQQGRIAELLRDYLAKQKT